jgi:hypothetical protein
VLAAIFAPRGPALTLAPRFEKDQTHPRRQFERFAEPEAHQASPHFVGLRPLLLA